MAPLKRKIEAGYKTEYIHTHTSAFYSKVNVNSPKR